MRSGDSCPVCGRQGLPVGCECCPQCDADLTCFQALDSLSVRKSASSAPSAQRTRRFPVRAAAVLLAVIALVLAGLLFNMKKNLQELDRRFTELKTAKSGGDRSLSSSERDAGAEKTGQHDDLTRISEKLTASSGKIYQVDARIRIIDESYDDFFGRKPKKQKDIEQEQEKRPDEENERRDSPEPRQQVRAEEEKDFTTTPQTKGLAETEEKTVQSTEKKQEKVPVQTMEKVEKKEPQKSLPLLKPEKSKLDLRKRAAARSPIRRDAGPKKLPALQDAPGKTFFYQAEKTNTLWSIAERFYGNGKYYPVILEQNPHLRINNINSRSKMWLFIDRRRAAALYQRKKEWRNGMLLWKYEVQPGETLHSVYRRFVSPASSGRVFYARNPHIVPGNTVRIILR